MSIEIISKLVNRPVFVRKFSIRFHGGKKSFLDRRQRNFKSDRSTYEVDFDSMTVVNDGHLQFRLSNTMESEKSFRLEIFTLEHQTLRLKINEENPLRQRYEAKESLVREPKPVA